METERVGLRCEKEDCGKKIEQGRLMVIEEQVQVWCGFCLAIWKSVKEGVPTYAKPKTVKLAGVVIPDIQGKPTKVIIVDQEIPVKSWCAVLEAVLMALNLEQFDKVLEAFPRFIGKDKTKFSRPKALARGAYYFEGRMQTDRLLALFQMIRKIVGFTPEQMRVVA